MTFGWSFELQRDCERLGLSRTVMIETERGSGGFGLCHGVLFGIKRGLMGCNRWDFGVNRGLEWWVRGKHFVQLYTLQKTAVTWRMQKLNQIESELNETIIFAE